MGISDILRDFTESRLGTVFDSRRSGRVKCSGDPGRLSHGRGNPWAKDSQLVGRWADGDNLVSTALGGTGSGTHVE